MGKKRRGLPQIDDILARPWCYYCERDFEDLKLLISHQKAKHFRCERCGKRLNTAGGLSVHMNQVHKESLEKVENALPSRQGLDIEIFGMEGVPEDVARQHTARIKETFFAAQLERQAQTGNAPRGQPGTQGSAKKLRVEPPEELLARLAEHRAKMAAQKAAAANGVTPIAGAPVDGQSPGQGASPFPPPQGGFPYTPPAAPGAPGAPAFPPGQAYPPSFPSGPSPPPGAAGAFNLPQGPPGGAPPASALPQRPPYWQSAAPPGYPGGASTVDELVAGAARQGDDIDQLIRMAEAGIKPGKPTTEDTGGEKKSKKDKMRMVYGDTEVSPEEKMATLPRYRFVEA